MKPKILFGLAAPFCALLLLGGLSPVQAKKDEESQLQQADVDSAMQARKHLSFGYRYLKNKQYEDAETQLTRSWGYDSQNAKTAYYLGRLYNETERFDEAVTWFNKAIELSPNGNNTRNAHYFLGQIYVMQEKRPEAIETYETLLSMVESSEQEIQYLHYLVSLYVEEEDFESALKYARRWGELEPNNPDIQDTIAKLALYTGEEDEALGQMEKVLDMNPEDYATLNNLARMYRQREMTGKAFDAYEKLHAHDPQNFLYLDYLLSLGKQLGKSKSYQLGILRKMLKLQPDNLSVIEQLADATGDIGLVNRALKLDPGNGKFNYMKGQYYYDRWKKSSTKQDSIYALSWFKKAQKDPQWSGNAKRMIDELDPPMSEEEKMKQKFFGKTKKKEEEVDIEGKK